MTVGDKVVNGLVARAVGFQHLRHDGILRELVRLKERDYHLVFGTSVIWKNEGAKINNADKEENGKNTFLGGSHAAMIPFPPASLPNC